MVDEFSKTQHNVKWLIVYCLAGKKVLLERFPSKTYDAPCPYELNDPSGSVDFMYGELKKSYFADWQWNFTEKVKYDMDVENYDLIAEEIIKKFN